MDSNNVESGVYEVAFFGDLMLPGRCSSLFLRGGNRVLVALLESEEIEEGRKMFLGDQMGFGEGNRLHFTLGWQARDTKENSHFMKLSRYGGGVMDSVTGC